MLYLWVPNVTIRDVTEHAETIECGSNVLTGSDPEAIVRAADVVLNSACDWVSPAGYVERHVSITVAKIVLGYQHGQVLTAKMEEGEGTNV